MSTAVTLVLLALSLLTSTITAIPIISVKGAKFFANGQQFFIKGVAYQGSPADPLTDVAQCNADASLMSSLGVNSIRVYHVSPYADHSGCMSVFAAHNIYVWLDLDTFNTSLVTQTTGTPSWTPAQLTAFTRVLDAFIAYPNLAGVWIGNEVITTPASSPAAPYILAAVADVKAYLAQRAYRALPIGYSAADIATLRPALQNYLACAATPAERVDFFGLNSYEWCGAAATYATSGYAHLQALSANYSLPIFFSETGCNVAPPRTFADQAAVFGPDMRDTWSGSIVYEWAMEANGYGLVTYPDPVSASGGGQAPGYPRPVAPDFANLAAQWQTLTPLGVAEAEYTPSLARPECPRATDGGWGVDGEVPLPTLGVDVVNAVVAAAGTVVVGGGSTWTSFPTLAGTPAVTGGTAVATAEAASTGTSSAAATTASSTQNVGVRRGERMGVVEVLVVGWVVVAVFM